MINMDCASSLYNKEIKTFALTATKPGLLLFFKEAGEQDFMMAMCH